jgi:hypothetical protein
MTAVAGAAVDPDRARLLRRIEALRERRQAPSPTTADSTRSGHVHDLRRRRAGLFAHRLADAVGGIVAEGPAGRLVRIDRSPIRLPLDRARLATLPGQPPPDAPLVCLDTETTGLGTAAGTIAFLVGLGWWDGGAFHQAQLLVPDQPDEPALLAALRALLPPTCWLVTYNGRGFDWPLLVTRFRLDRDAPPELAGHLDLLPIVRGLFKHRLSDARLRTVEAELLGLGRVGDVAGWEIPARYLGFLRDGDAGGLVEVVRHNHEDVRSLARLLAHLADGLGRSDARADAHPGDLAGLARMLARDGRTQDAIACLDLAIDRPLPVREPDVPWWSPRAAADVGGRAPVRSALPGLGDRLDSSWTAERIERERARLLRRAGRVDDAVAAWRGIALRGGRIGALAWVEVAKLEEHLRRDPAAALAAVERGQAQASRLRSLGLPIRGLDADLQRRRGRLVARIARRRPHRRRRPMLASPA